jgi:hypothetical protein
VLLHVYGDIGRRGAKYNLERKLLAHDSAETARGSDWKLPARFSGIGSRIQQERGSQFALVLTCKANIIFTMTFSSSSKSLALLGLMASTAHGFCYIPEPEPVDPPDAPIECPIGYEYFIHDFSEFSSREYIDGIEGFASITAFATPFLRKGYTPVPPGRNETHSPWGGAARVITTKMKDCKADTDLCCPNVNFGGDGNGDGGQSGPGQNKYEQGNAIIIQEKDKRTSDDSVNGGGLLINLLQPKDFAVVKFGLIDVGGAGGDESENTLDVPSFAVELDGFGLPSMKIIPDLGDNSVQEVVFEGSRYSGGYFLRFQGSGALSYVKGCMKNPEFPENFPEPPTRRKWM